MGLAAHIPPVTAVESNARQYVPAANTRLDVAVSGYLSRFGNGRFYRPASWMVPDWGCRMVHLESDCRRSHPTGASPGTCPSPARNFGGAPLRESLERIAAIGFDTCDNFDWRDAAVFAEYRIRVLRGPGLGAGVLVVNKKPDVNALGCSLVSPDERGGFLAELLLCIHAAHQVGCTRLEVLTGNALRRRAPATPDATPAWRR